MNYVTAQSFAKSEEMTINFNQDVILHISQVYCLGLCF